MTHRSLRILDSVAVTMAGLLQDREIKLVMEIRQRCQAGMLVVTLR